MTWQVDSAHKDIDKGQQALSADIARVDSELKRLDAARKEPESLQEYNITVLKEVKESLRANDPALEKIVAQMTAEGATGRLRVRMLPVKVNQRAGYGIQGYVIRRNNDEQKQAEALKRIGDEVVGATDRFQIGTSIQPTPYYLSAFLCPQP